MKNSRALSAFHALAQESRLEVYLLLLRNNGEGLAAGDISKMLDIPPTTMSFHLAQLKNSALVNTKKQGRYVIYTVDMKRAKKLSKFIVGKSDQFSDQKNIKYTK